MLILLAFMSNYKGDFDWLRQRLDVDMAECLQPIGLGLTYVRAGDIYSRESLATEVHQY